RARLVMRGKRPEGGMTLRLPPDGEVVKTACVTGFVFIPGAKQKPRMGIYVVSSGCTPEREVCSVGVPVIREGHSLAADKTFEWRNLKVPLLRGRQSGIGSTRYPGKTTSARKCPCRPSTAARTSL